MLISAVLVQKSNHQGNANNMAVKICRCRNVHVQLQRQLKRDTTSSWQGHSLLSLTDFYARKQLDSF